MRWMKVMIALAAAATLAAGSFAQSPGDGRRPDGRGNRNVGQLILSTEVQKELKLTKDQLDKKELAKLKERFNRRR